VPHSACPLTLWSVCHKLEVASVSHKYLQIVSASFYLPWESVWQPSWAVEWPSAARVASPHLREC